ncbi:hypothetical protein A3Q56_04359 [Intoshia linei]|uniref:BolA-like protein 3 n=1 Tax=Intoshia linei TaxID=1819745 RepID=A0A177B0L6_9BILA|nr:hypothetical protein A3Q56_04359 [Intoshia linei]
MMPDKISVMSDCLKKRFPRANVQIDDISGGCGSMFSVFVKTDEFKNMSLLKQHKSVNQTLKDHIRDMHGIRIKTSH